MLLKNKDSSIPVENGPSWRCHERLFLARPQRLDHVVSRLSRPVIVAVFANSIGNRLGRVYAPEREEENPSTMPASL
jgi:hypothetical protein